MSTAKLLARHGLPDQEKIALLRGHRSTHLRLQGILIRDQVPMPPAALAPALDDGMEPSDWYALVNEHVFLWPDRERMYRHLKACGSRLQSLMTFDAAKLFRDFGDQAFVSPINSGNARRRPARRGRDTFIPYRMWIEHGWTTGQRGRGPAEFLFRCDVPATPPYLICIEKLQLPTADKERTSTMRPPLEIVKELYARLTAGDSGGALALMSDDIEWITMMDYKVDGRGPQKVLEGMLRPAMQEWQPYTLTPHEFICDGGKIVSVGRFKGTNRVTGKHVEVDYSHIWEVRDGKIVRHRQFIDTGKIEPARRPG